MRDHQKSAMYRWEDTVIVPRGGGIIPTRQVQNFINHIWSEMGLLYPPTFTPMSKTATRTMGRGDRLDVKLTQDPPTWLLLHELAHSMTSTHEGNEEGHGPNYVGVYMQLCHKFLGIGLLELQHTATMMGIEYNINAKPSFL